MLCFEKVSRKLKGKWLWILLYRSLLDSEEATETKDTRRCACSSKRNGRSRGITIIGRTTTGGTTIRRT